MGMGFKGEKEKTYLQSLSSLRQGGEVTFLQSHTSLLSEKREGKRTECERVDLRKVANVIGLKKKWGEGTGTRSLREETSGGVLSVVSVRGRHGVRPCI